MRGNELIERAAVGFALALIMALILWATGRI